MNSNENDTESSMLTASLLEVNSFSAGINFFLLAFK
jgi:hypothetical protein